MNDSTKTWIIVVQLWLLALILYHMNVDHKESKGSGAMGQHVIYYFTEPVRMEKDSRIEFYGEGGGGAGH